MRIVKGEPRCKNCQRKHVGECDPAAVERLRKQHDTASKKQFQLYRLCLNYVRSNHPDVYDQFAQQVGKKWYYNE